MAEKIITSATAVASTTLTVRAQIAMMALPLAFEKYPQDPLPFVAQKAVEYADELIKALNA